MSIEVKIPHKIIDMTKIGNKYYALGSGIFSVSDDYVNWTTIDPNDEARRVHNPHSNWPDYSPYLYNICGDGNGTIILVHDTGAYVSKDDGMTFDFISAVPGKYAWYDSQSGKFFSIDDDLVMESEDGIIWNIPDNSALTPKNTSIFKKEDGSHIVIRGESIYHTDNFETWNYLGNPLKLENVHSTSVAYQNGKYMSYKQDDGKIYISSDGITLDSVSDSSLNVGYTSPYLFHVNGKYVLSGNSSTYISDDGIYWSFLLTPNYTQIIKLLFHNDYYVAVFYEGDLMRSTSLSSWETGLTNIFDVLYDGTAFVALSKSGTVYRSVNGSSWTELGALRDDIEVFPTFFGRNATHFVAFDGKYVYFSEDGITWDFNPLNILKSIRDYSVFALTDDSLIIRYGYRNKINISKDFGLTFEYPFEEFTLEVNNFSKYIEEKGVLVIGNAASVDNGITLIPTGIQTSHYTKYVGVSYVDDIILIETTDYTGTATYRYSTDGITWKRFLVKNAPVSYYQGIGELVKIGDTYYSRNGYKSKNLIDWQGAGFITTDGVTWTETKDGYPPGENECYSVKVLSGNILAEVNNTITGRKLWVSTDGGITFNLNSGNTPATKYDSFGYSDRYAFRVEPVYYNDTTYIDYYVLKFSNNGIDWEILYNDYSQLLVGPSYENLVCTGTYYDKYLYDADTKTRLVDFYYDTPLGENNDTNIQGILRIDGTVYIYVGNYSGVRIYYTTDFNEWNSIVTSISYYYFDTIRIGNKYYIYTYGDNVWSSTDGLNWEEDDLLTNTNIAILDAISVVDGVTFLQGYDINDNFLLIYSYDLINWTEIETEFSGVTFITGDSNGYYLIGSDSQLYKFTLSGEFEVIQVDPDSENTSYIDFITPYDVPISKYSQLVKYLPDGDTIRLVVESAGSNGS